MNDEIADRMNHLSFWIEQAKLERIKVGPFNTFKHVPPSTPSSLFRVRSDKNSGLDVPSREFTPDMNPEGEELYEYYVGMRHASRYRVYYGKRGWLGTAIDNLRVAYESRTSLQYAHIYANRLWPRIRRICPEGFVIDVCVTNGYQPTIVNGRPPYTPGAPWSPSKWGFSGDIYGYTYRT